jgi:hypothetical protein
MKNTNTGGSAFPSKREHTTKEGMTLRDYFAAKAMQSLILKSTGADFEIPDAAEDAYSYADAMLKAREA